MLRIEKVGTSFNNHLITIVKSVVKIQILTRANNNSWQVK